MTPEEPGATRETEMAEQAGTPKQTKAQQKVERLAQAVRDMEAIAGGRFVNGKFVPNP